MTTQPAAVPSRVLVTDFDGTTTRNDFYKLVIESLPPAGAGGIPGEANYSLRGTRPLLCRDPDVQARTPIGSS